MWPLEGWISLIFNLQPPLFHFLTFENSRQFFSSRESYTAAVSWWQCAPETHIQQHCWRSLNGKVTLNLIRQMDVLAQNHRTMHKQTTEKNALGKYGWLSRLRVVFLFNYRASVLSSCGVCLLYHNSDTAELPVTVSERPRPWICVYDHTWNVSPCESSKT